MKIGEALKKGLLKIESLDGMDWIVDTDGSKIIGYVSGIEDTVVTITKHGKVTGIFL